MCESGTDSSYQNEAIENKIRSPPSSPQMTVVILSREGSALPWNILTGAPLVSPPVSHGIRRKPFRFGYWQKWPSWPSPYSAKSSRKCPQVRALQVIRLDTFLNQNLLIVTA